MMAGRIRHHRPRGPARRISSSQPGYFYPGEVVRLLGLEDIDYAQLRELLGLVRGRALGPRKWARYDLHDLACLRAGIDLAGGRPALRRGRRLRLEPLRRAVAALRLAGFAEPLLDAGLTVLDGRLVATSADVIFDPTTGQTALDFVQHEAVRYLRENVVVPADFSAVRRVLASERKAMRPVRARAAGAFPWPVDVVGV